MQRTNYRGGRLAALYIALGCLLSLLAPVASAYGIQNEGVHIEVVDAAGRPFPTFDTRERSRDGVRRAYLEARPGAAYALRISNPRPVRVGVVIAIDGRNIISGKRSNLSRREQMYVLEPWQSAVYRGWRTGRNRVNEFFFTRDVDSYAGAFGDFSAMGVLAVAVFDDRHQPVYRDHRQPQLYSDKSGRGDAQRRRNGSAEAAPGTGFGDERYSPSYRVPFDARRRALSRTFIKYEWPETLCDIGVVRCGYAGNRFWPGGRAHRYARRGFAEYPPGYRVPRYGRNR